MHNPYIMTEQIRGERQENYSLKPEDRGRVSTLPY